MQSEPQNPTLVDLSKLHTICKIESGFFHNFGIMDFRQLVDICDCEIMQQISTEGTLVATTHYIKVGTFLERIDDSLFAMATFQNMVTFVFQNKQAQENIYLLSFQTNNPALQYFSQMLKSASQVVGYKTDNYEKTSLKEKIDSVIGGELTQESIQNTGVLRGVLKTFGSMLGSVAKNVAQPTLKAQFLIHNGIQSIADKYVSQQNKTRWNTLKQGASKLNKKMTQYYKPIDNAFKWVFSTVGYNFNQSQNKYIRNLKNYATVTATTLNDSYKKAQDQFMRGNGNQNKVMAHAQLHEQSATTLASFKN